MVTSPEMYLVFQFFLVPVFMLLLLLLFVMYAAIVLLFFFCFVFAYLVGGQLNCTGFHDEIAITTFCSCYLPLGPCTVFTSMYSTNICMCLSWAAGFVHVLMMASSQGHCSCHCHNAQAHKGSKKNLGEVGRCHFLVLMQSKKSARAKKKIRGCSHIVLQNRKGRNWTLPGICLCVAFYSTCGNRGNWIQPNRNSVPQTVVTKAFISY